jgi:hypothetical protein
METYEKVIGAIIGLVMIAGMMLGGDTSHAAEEGVCGPDVVPIVLTAGRDSTGYIQPSCSKCSKLKVQRQTTASDEVQGVLELVYSDEHGPFDGEIEVTAVLADGSEHLVVIEDVWLDQGDEAAWVIEASEGWCWDAVEMVRLEFVVGE